MKCTIRELKEAVREAVQLHAARETVTLIEGILNEREGLLDKIGSALGRSNPSKDVDDPKKVKKQIDTAIQSVEKKGDAFKKDALADTKRVNDYHDAVRELLDKVTALGDSLPGDEGAASEKKMLSAVKTFYSSLRQSADRLETFMKAVSNDVGEKGYDKRMPYNNATGLKGREEKKMGPSEPATLDALDGDEKSLKKLLGTKPTWEKEKETPDLDVDDKGAVSRFLRGKKK